MGASPDEQVQYKDAQTPTSSQGFCQRLRQDKDYRRRVMHTSFVMFAFFTMGWMVGMDGPAFPDIRQKVVHKDLETAAWIQTAGGLGYLFGTILGGASFDRFNRLGILSTATMGMALTKIVTPYCSNFVLMIVISIVHNTFMGSLDACGNSRVSSLWGEKAGPFMHVIHFGFSCGAIIGPLATDPFLAPKQCLNDSITTISPLSTLHYGTTLAFNNHTENTSNNTHVDCIEEYGETRVQYAFLQVAILGFLAALPFLVTLVLRKDATTDDAMKLKKVETGNTNEEFETSKLPALSLKLKIFFAILLAILLGLYCGVESRFSEFLMTFVIEKLDWSKTKGSLMTSIFWATFSFGRLYGVVVVRIFKPATMILSYSVALVVCFAVFLVAVNNEIGALVWTMTSLSGFAMSVIFPSIFTWTAESFMPVTGKVSGLYLAFVSAVNMALPLLYGHLMQNLDQVWFLYLLLGQSILLCILFLVIVALRRILIQEK